MIKKESQGDMPPINEQPKTDSKDGREKIYTFYKLCIDDGFQIKTVAVMCDLEVEELEKIIYEFKND